VELTCHLYRIISLYVGKEFYTEQLILRPEGLAKGKRISLAFRAHYYSFLDCPEEVPVQLARLENIPDYFAVWRYWGRQHRGYAFASDSHIHKIRIQGKEIHWRLHVGHEHRCIHMFPFHGFHEFFKPFDEIGHTGWYEWMFKPLQSIPLDRYVSL